CAGAGSDRATTAIATSAPGTVRPAPTSPEPDDSSRRPPHGTDGGRMQAGGTANPPSDRALRISHIPAIFTGDGVFRALFLLRLIHRVAALREGAGSSLRVRCATASPYSLREGART